MEDILASIKRIIAEDGEAATERAVQRPPRKGPVAVPDAVADAVVDVADAPVAAIPPEPDIVPEPQAELSDVLELTSPLADIPSEDRIPEPMTASSASSATILSPSAETASRTAFAALSQLQVRAEEGRENTLEGLVADMLRPMLREWLDRELPAVVERLVAAEVARVSGRG